MAAQLEIAVLEGDATGQELLEEALRAPALEGKDLANPTAMILAGAALLHYAATLGHDGAPAASQAIYDAVLATAADGVRTPDLGGDASSSEVTDAVIERVAARP